MKNALCVSIHRTWKAGKPDKINGPCEVLTSAKKSNPRSYTRAHTKISKKSNRPIHAKFEGHHKSCLLRPVVGIALNSVTRSYLTKSSDAKSMGAIQLILERTTQIRKLIWIVVFAIDLLVIGIIISRVGRHFIPKDSIAISANWDRFTRNRRNFWIKP